MSKKFTDIDILKLVNEINQKNNPAIEDYIEKFFVEYLENDFFEELTFTGKEHRNVENAITHLIQVSTLISVQTTLKVLSELGAIERTKES